MKLSGRLEKMQTTHKTPVEYHLICGEDRLCLNEWLGAEITIQFGGDIFCLSCGRKTKKSYSQGHCFPCSQRLASCDQCILKPELCHHHLGTCREPEWGLANCFIPHIIYLANTSGLKVGITRETQIPTRWMDQGAIQALPILRVKTRRQSGLIEVALAKSMSDKTNWRKMLNSAGEAIHLERERDRIYTQNQADIQSVAESFDFGDIELLTQEKVVEFDYPVTAYPDKLRSLTLAKNPEITGILKGIKGQYLIFDNTVFNVRNHTAHCVEIELK